MKTLVRILIITFAAVVIGAGMVALVNANGSGLTPGGFPGDDGFRPEGDRPAFEGMPRPEGEAPERHERGEMGGGWIFGLLKNIGVIAILVAIIVLPKKFKPKKPALPNSGTA